MFVYYHPPRQIKESIMLSTIKLFKALPVNESQKFNEEAYLAFTKETVKSGYILDREAFSAGTDVVIELINKVYGRNPEQLNKSFHRSFAKVKNSSTAELVFEQSLHYLTTYGAESMGVYSEDNVFIPAEAFDIPELKDGIRLVVIRGLTNDEIKAELLKLLSSGIALASDTVKGCIDVAQFVGLGKDEVEQVNNKEVRTALYDYFGIAPSNATEFLRYIIYKATEETAIIKNRTLIEKIKGRDNYDIVKYFEAYEEQWGLERLATVFYRFKPLFLAFRTNTALKKKINSIRRLAAKNHKPMPEDLLNTITARLDRHDAPSTEEFLRALENTNTFRKVRLAQALKFRTTGVESILYRVRNGKSFAKEFKFDNKAGAEIVHNIILKSIASEIATNIKDKIFYIPEGVNYAMPSTEKQFVGNIPGGSYIEIPKDARVGVHWKNVGSHRVDLDLSLVSASGKIGWDSVYRNENRSVLYSGDVVDAPGEGASEVFAFDPTARGAWNLNLNYFNFRDDVSVPFKMFIAEEEPRNLTKNFVVDPNKIIASVDTEIDVRQKIIGLVVSTDGHTRFYFTESQFENNISARNTEAAEHARKFLAANFDNQVSLNEVLSLAGAKVVTNRDITMREDQELVDLSPEAIDKVSLIELLTKQEA